MEEKLVEEPYCHSFLLEDRGPDPLYLFVVDWLAGSITVRSQAGHQHSSNQSRGKEYQQCDTIGAGPVEASTHDEGT
jgi:hypothetical protein